MNGLANILVSGLLAMSGVAYAAENTLTTEPARSTGTHLPTTRELAQDQSPTNDPGNQRIGASSVDLNHSHGVLDHMYLDGSCEDAHRSTSNDAVRGVREQKARVHINAARRN
jgi:hypothetical protein